MKALDTLTPLAATVIALRNDGYDVISVSMIVEKHVDRGYALSAKTVLRRLCRVQKELRIAYPALSTHLVTKYYVAKMPDMRRFARCHLPPQSDTEIEAVAIAKTCLAIGEKAFAIRFVTGKDDFLCRVWEFFFLNKVATGLLASRVRSTAQAAENRHIPSREAATNIVGAVLAVGPAINGSKQLPKELKEIKAKAEGTFSGAWEKNFNKTRKGAWRL